MGIWQQVVLVALAGVLIFAVWHRIRRPRRGLVVGRRGILDRSLGWGWIPWDEIEGAYPPDSSDDSLRVKLRVTDRLAGVLRERSGEAVDGSVEIRLELAGTGIDPVELMHRIVASAGQVSAPDAPPES